MNPDNDDGKKGSDGIDVTGEVQAIEISEPGVVKLVSDASIPCCPPGHALVRTIYTSVSPGTELLLFRGDMPEDIEEQGLDSKIPTLRDHPSEENQYPRRYGYSAVGTIIQITMDSNENTDGNDENENGEHEKNINLSDHQKLEVGDTVFAFREHTSYFVSSLSDLYKIPGDVRALDAVLYPAMETALSIIFDATPCPGDVISIIGQGLIGLLVSLLLHHIHPTCTIITSDMSSDRRNLSLQSSKAQMSMPANISSREKRLRTSAYITQNKRIFPDDAEISDEEEDDIHDADICIEVSGTAAGLNTAMDTVGHNGRIVIASWYGNKPIVVPALGSARFHRSHVSLVMSQVSEIPTQFAGRWTKERRGKLVWTLMQKMKPVVLLDIPTFAPKNCQHVFEGLAKKEFVAGIFQWSSIHKEEF